MDNHLQGASGRAAGAFEMSVAAHLGIDLNEYDERIRTFIPRYEEMLDQAAGAIEPRVRRLVDLGIGTGALASRCLARAPHARVIGIDADNDILGLAGRRLGSRVTLVRRSFLTGMLPAADAIVASLALHHVSTTREKARLYRNIFKALRPRGVVVTADAHPSAAAGFAKDQFGAWKGHVGRSYTPAQTRALFRAWAGEDYYMPLETEIALMRRAGFAVDVRWRSGVFAVLAGVKS